MYQMRWRAAAAMAIFVSTLLLGGCAAITVGEIMADPQYYANRDVKVRGEVVESHSELGRGAY